MSNEAYAEKRYLMGEIEKVKAECERRIAEEREACAQIVEADEDDDRFGYWIHHSAQQERAAAIRARQVIDT